VNSEIYRCTGPPVRRGVHRGHLTSDGVGLTYVLSPISLVHTLVSWVVCTPERRARMYQAHTRESLLQDICACRHAVYIGRSIFLAVTNTLNRCGSTTICGPDTLSASA